jgi:hypothetical protein
MLCYVYLLEIAHGEVIIIAFFCAFVRGELRFLLLIILLEILEK